MKKLTIKDIEKIEIKLKLIDRNKYKGTLSHSKLGVFHYHGTFIPSTEGMNKGFIKVDELRETLLNEKGESFYHYDMDDDVIKSYENKLDEAQIDMLSQNVYLYPDLNWDE